MANVAVDREVLQLRRTVETLTREKAQTTRTMQSDKEYIRKLEAKLATGGLAEKYAKLEAKFSRFQKRCQSQEEAIKAQRSTIEEQQSTVRALNEALQMRLDSWKESEGDALDSEMVIEVARCREELNRKEQQVANQTELLNRLANDLSEMSLKNKLLLTTADHNQLEQTRSREMIDQLTQALRGVEGTKAEMLKHMEARVAQASALESQLKQEQAERKFREEQLEARVAELEAEQSGLRAEAKGAHLRMKQLNLLKEVMDDKIATETSLVKNLTEKVHQLEKHILTLERVNEETKFSVSSVEQGMELAQSRADALAESKAKAEEHIKQLTSEYAELRNLYSVAKERAAKLDMIQEEASRQQQAHQLCCDHFARIGQPVAKSSNLVHQVAQLIQEWTTMKYKLDTLESNTTLKIQHLELELERGRLSAQSLSQEVENRTQEVQRLHILNEATRRTLGGVRDSVGDPQIHNISPHDIKSIRTTSPGRMSRDEARFQRGLMALRSPGRSPALSDGICSDVPQDWGVSRRFCGSMDSATGLFLANKIEEPEKIAPVSAIGVIKKNSAGDDDRVLSLIELAEVDA